MKKWPGRAVSGSAWTQGTVGEVLGMIEEMIGNEMCKDANNLADAINTGEILIECP